MSNKLRVDVTVLFVGDGVSTSVSFNLITDPIFQSTGSPLTNLFNLGIKTPTSVTATFANFSSASISGETVTVNLVSAVSGNSSLPLTLVF